MKHAPWQIRAFGDIAVGAVFFALMFWQGAPAWALILLVAVFTRLSRADAAADLGDVQASARALRRVLEGEPENRISYTQEVPMAEAGEPWKPLSAADLYPDTTPEEPEPEQPDEPNRYGRERDSLGR